MAIYSLEVESAHTASYSLTMKGMTEWWMTMMKWWIAPCISIANSSVFECGMDDEIRDDTQSKITHTIRWWDDADDYTNGRTIGDVIRSSWWWLISSSFLLRSYLPYRHPSMYHILIPRGSSPTDLYSLPWRGRVRSYDMTIADEVLLYSPMMMIIFIVSYIVRSRCRLVVDAVSHSRSIVSSHDVSIVDMRPLLHDRYSYRFAHSRSMSSSFVVIRSVR